MIIDRVNFPIASLYYYLVKRRERNLGYALHFKKLSKDWIGSIMLFDMTPVWKKYGIDAKGVNYFTLGRVENGISNRYNPKSSFFQSWLGGYIVQFGNSKQTWTIQDHLALGVADQKNWLTYYGDVKPYVKAKRAIKKVQITIGEYKGVLYEGDIESDTDIGNGSPFLLSFAMGIMANIFKKNNMKLALTYKDFIPYLTDNFPLTSYQRIVLSVYIVILNLDTKTKAVLYVNASSFMDKENKQHNNFQKIKSRLLEQIKSISVERYNSK